MRAAGINSSGSYRLFDLHCLFRDADIPRYTSRGLPWLKTMFSFEPTVHFPAPPTGPIRSGPAERLLHRKPLRRPAGLSATTRQSPASPRFYCRTTLAGFLTPESFARLVADDYLADSDYREAIWRSRINLSFVTIFNEDDIGHKSIEIAACQGFLLALRTPGHQACFEEDHEAVFFSGLEECSDKCRFYLDKPQLRDEIARRGRERAVRSGYDNDTQLARILNYLDGRQVSASPAG